MVRKKGKSALGKGLRALIKDNSEREELDRSVSKDERHARNMEFYGSLMKKYVRSGAEDDLIDQMLNDVRKHMGISRKEHKNLLETLRKRESTNPPKESEQKIAQTEIKEELSEIYKRLKLKKGLKKNKDKFKKLEESIEKDEQDEAISLSNGKDKKKDRVQKVIKRRLVARDLDERAGIIDGPPETLKGQIEWSEEEDKPIRVPAPQDGMEDNVEPIKTTAPQEGLEDSDEAIKAGPRNENLDDSEEKIITPPPSQPEGSEEKYTIKLGSKKIDDSSGPAIEAPPSEVPADPSPGFVMVKKSTTGNEDIEFTGPTEEMGEEIEDDTTLAVPEEEDINEMEEKVAAEDIGEEMDYIPEEGEPMVDEEERITELDEEPEEAVDVVDEEGPIDEMEEAEEMLDDSLISMKMLLSEDRIDEAYDMGERLLDDDPDNISILNEMGVVLYHKEMINEALALYQGLMDKEPGSVETLINYATLLSVTGNLDNSLECLDKAVKKDPYSEDAWNNKAVVLTRAGRLREALECLDEALRINEETPSTWMNAGVVLERMGEIGPALECYESLLKHDPGNKVAMEGIMHCKSLLRK